MKEITELESSKIEKVIAGGSNGSIILFDLCKNDVKYVLYIYCTWRLTVESRLLVGCHDISISNNSNFVVELKKLENLTIITIITNSLGDFTIIFENGKRIDVFCDITQNIETDLSQENWTVCNLSTNKCVNHTSNFNFTEEQYEQ